MHSSYGKKDMQKHMEVVYLQVYLFQDIEYLFSKIYDDRDCLHRLSTVLLHVLWYAMIIHGEIVVAASPPSLPL
jgi:hypothetical protein